jgi:hypothetical protein
MYTQGMTFGTEGPVMSGTWYHPTNGDKFTVADTFFEDNQLLVRTTDGRLLNYNIIQNYIQQSATDNSTQMSTELPREVMELVEPIQDKLYEPIGNLYYNTQETAVVDSKLSDQPIVDKALSKTELPELKIELVWNKYPEREIEMLKDIMDIPVDEIIQWYINKFDLDNIRQQISNSINKTLNNEFIQEISVEGDTLTIKDEDLPNKSRKTGKKTK